MHNSVKFFKFKIHTKKESIEKDENLKNFRYLKYDYVKEIKNYN